MTKTELVEKIKDLTEEEVVSQLLSGLPTRVYHLLTDETHFDGVLTDGLRGNYTIRTSVDDSRPVLGLDGRPLSRAYFRLIEPKDGNPGYIYFDLNKVGEPVLKIYDGRLKDEPANLLLTAGYDGSVRAAGVVPGGDNYQWMLTLFDGGSLKGKAQKFSAT